MTQTYEYDSEGRLSGTHTGTSTNQLTFSYDTAGTITTTDAAGGIFQVFMDHRGLAVRQASGTGYYVNYTYDQHRMLTKTTDALGPYGFVHLHRRRGLDRVRNGRPGPHHEVPARRTKRAAIDLHRRQRQLDPLRLRRRRQPDGHHLRRRQRRGVSYDAQGNAIQLGTAAARRSHAHSTRPAN